MSKGKSKNENPTSPIAKQVQRLIESDGGEVIKYNQSKKQQHKFTYSLGGQIYTYTESGTPGINPSDQHILKRLRKYRQEAKVIIKSTFTMMAKATPQGSPQGFRAWLLRPGKTPEQLAFEEQMGKKAKQSGNW